LIFTLSPALLEEDREWEIIVFGRLIVSATFFDMTYP
jgi:hypothetical protein